MVPEWRAQRNHWQTGQLKEMGLAEKAAASEHLGQEFATWLYWRSSTHGSRVKLDGVEEFQVWFESPVELVSDWGDATAVVVSGGLPLDSPEAHRALREGKRIAKARLRLIVKNQTHTCAFDASVFAVSGLKVPLPPNLGGGDAMLLRLELFEEFEAFLSQIFEAFLRLRLDDKAWAGEAKKMSAWVAGLGDA